MLVLLLFFCSGATALVYEVLWSKHLALLFGSTIQAQTVVLAVFMGGLALGNKLFSRSADRAAHPLAIYGRIEVAIGIYALVFSLLYWAADKVFVGVGSHLLDRSRWLLALKGILSVALLLGPTILMGGTLPVLAAWLQRHTPDAGRRSARFYSTNSLGAVCGAGLTGFLLVPWLGMPTTMRLAAGVNLLIGFTAIYLGGKETTDHGPRTTGPLGDSPHPNPSPEGRGEAGAVDPRSSRQVFRWGCVLVALTGAVSMGLEVLASRCLCLIFGASLQVFAIVLMAFILGIGLGSAAIASRRRKEWPKEVTTVMLLLAAAGFLGFLVYNIEGLAWLYLQTQSGLTRSPMGFRYHQVLTSVISICVLGLPAAALGSVLPLWIRVVSETSDMLGERVGRLLTWNTLGAVGGVLLTGFVLMPTIGLRGAFTALALVLAVAALLTALATHRFLPAGAGVLATGLLVFVSAHGNENWRYVFSSGIYRAPTYETSRELLLTRAKLVRLVFYEDAADATVSVEKELTGARGVCLRINGKPDATSHGDLSTQRLLAQLPLLAKPGSKEVFGFGMGSGISGATALGFPIEHLTIAENCEPVLRAVPLFEPWNHGVFTNSRVRIYREDARTVLKLGPQHYDVIFAEPSNPWMAGVGSVFSQEFYRIAAQKLAPGGIMAQWFHTYEMDDATVDMVVRTFASVFPNMEIWDVDGGDIVMLGSAQPWKSGPEVYRSAFQFEGPRNDLTELGLTSPEAVLARRLASQRTAYAVPGPGQIQRDEFPVLEYAAPRAFYMYLQARGVKRLYLFDERTWQKDLLSTEETRTLVTLDEDSLKRVFSGDYYSTNPDLMTFMKYRLENRVGTVVSRNHAMPCVFQGRNLVLYAPPSAGTNAMTRQLYDAEAAIRKDPTQEPQAVLAIKQVLDATQPETYVPEKADWCAAYYANVAVNICLRLGNDDLARAILLRGLQLDPESEELHYLERILTHEGILLPKMGRR